MHSSSSRTFIPTLAFAIVAVAFAPGGARAAGDAATAGVGVARISVIQGSVAVQRGDSGTQTAAALNAPVLGADYVTTGDAARAELQLDAVTALRLGPNTQMRFTHLDARNREVALAAGTIELRSLRTVDGTAQIDTPSVSVAARTAGRYRVTVDADGRTEVTVRSGRADVLSPQLVQSLLPGSTLVATGSAANPAIQTVAAIAPDDFDRFNDDRDRGEVRALANVAYAATEMSGLSDLDTYGRWVNDPAYGRVWAPYATTADWAPYRDGRWVWEDGFGWTWIGYEPWGWAPYHYGRWYYASHYGWCWYPQRSFVAWRPALVGFFTFGNGFSLGLGNIAWVPLAPFEPYYPWWGPRFGGTTVFNNVTYVTNNYYGNVNNGQIIKIYGNWRHHGGTYLPHQRFTEGSFTHPLAIEPSHMRSIEVVRGPLRVVPNAANLRFSDRPVAAQLAVKPAFTERTFAGGAKPVARIPFEQQRTAVAQITHVEVTPHYVSEPRSVAAPVTRGKVEVIDGARTTTQPATDPWSRFGHSRGVPVTTGSAAAGSAQTTRTAGTAGTTAGTAAIVPGTAHGRDAWTRFDTAPAHRATVVSEPPRRGEQRVAPTYVQHTEVHAAPATTHATTTHATTTHTERSSSNRSSEHATRH